LVELDVMLCGVVIVLVAGWVLLSPPSVVATTVDSSTPTAVECGSVASEAFGDAVTMTDTGPVITDADRKCQAQARLELIAVPVTALVLIVSLVLLYGRLRRTRAQRDSHLAST
jgi:hypothetical protein